jgi:hypothetical protein
MDLKEIDVEAVPAICEALVAACPSSLHFLGLLLAPCLSQPGSSQDQLLQHLSEILKSGDFQLRIIGNPSSGEVGEPQSPWGLVAVAIGGGRGAAVARAHFWLSTETGIKYDTSPGIPATVDREAQHIFKQAVQEFVIPAVRKAGVRDCMFHSLNDCWKSLLADMDDLHILRDNPCVKAAKLYQPGTNKGMVISRGYIVRQAEPSDVPTVSPYRGKVRSLSDVLTVHRAQIRAANKIPFEEGYLLSRTHMSAVVATKEGQPASWALSHDDCEQMDDAAVTIARFD